MNTDTLLIEIGTEELPPKAVKQLGEIFTAQVAEQLQEQQFSFNQKTAFFTPRRLALTIEGLSSRQPDQTIERKGPALSAAFDQEGNPSKAAVGFAKSCGVELNELDRIENDKGRWLYFKSAVVGKTVEQAIPEIIETALQNLPIPRPMRWGKSTMEFVRPIHWVVVMFGDEVVNCRIKQIQASNVTYGHRFHAPEGIHLKHANDYEVSLGNAYVVASYQKRRANIQAMLEEQADQLDAKLNYDDSLLEEVTNLVEFPSLILGEFSPSFLEIPHEALVVTMQEAQRYFPLYSKQDDTLLNYFIAIANIDSKNPETVKRGNERVIKPRFDDATFFWQRDCSTRLDTKIELLNGILFEKQLGSLLDKVKRVENLCENLCGSLKIDPSSSKRAAQLCKCDLLSEMVYEFPKLQGIMGRYYALNDGESSEIANAIQEHYQPIQAGGDIAPSITGKIVAICDRVDTLVGIFSTGKKPTGVKDPYALRRAALGIVRISIEGNIDFDVRALLNQAASLLPIQLKTNVNEIEEFIYERLRSYFTDAGFQPDTFDAVRSVNPSSLMDFNARVYAVHEFRKLPQAASLAAANKRIRNILKKVESPSELPVASKLLNESAESNLFYELIDVEKAIAPVIDKRDYTDALASLAKLKETIDSFFDEVMVMDDDLDIRNNRIALVSRVKNQFSAIADISCLQS